MRKWEDALKEHKQAILDKGYKEEQLLGIFLYGSQNYGCETEESDIDTKAIYIPTFEELCFDNPVSKEIQLKNGEHCEIKVSAIFGINIFINIEKKLLDIILKKCLTQSAGRLFTL